MATYIAKYEETLLTHISENVERRCEQLVINRQMPDNDVHWHRGYIAALRDLSVYIGNELPKKMNEDPK